MTELEESPNLLVKDVMKFHVAWNVSPFWWLRKSFHRFVTDYGALQIHNFLCNTHRNIFMAVKTAQKHFQSIQIFKDCWAIAFFFWQQFTSLLGNFDVLLPPLSRHGLLPPLVSKFVPLTESQKWLVCNLAKRRWWKPQGDVGDPS